MNDGGRDRSMIWDDCAECAYKHLTAACAAFTAAGTAAPHVAPRDVLTARAWILFGEAESGYTGNADLAAGCLALAENLCDGFAEASDLRELRKRAFKANARDVWPGTRMPAMPAFAAAHFTEALRELPALAERFGPDCWTGDSGFNVTDSAAFLDALRINIKWVRETYELKGSEK